MDKPPAKTASSGTASGTSLLQQILNRRSTKVEPAAIGMVVHNDVTVANAATKPTPHPIFSNGISSNHIGASSQPPHSKHGHSTSAQSSPVAASNHASQRRSASSLRRHSSSHDVTAILHANASTNADASADHQPHRQRRHPTPASEFAKKEKPLRHNRFSHQFTLCCSFNDDRIGTPPPVSVRYNSLATATTTMDRNGERTAHSDGVVDRDGGFDNAKTSSTSSASRKTVVTVLHMDADPMPSAVTPNMLTRSVAATTSITSSSASSSNVAVVSAADRVTSDVSSSASIHSSPAPGRFGESSVRSSTEPNTPARQLQPTIECSPALLRRRPKHFARATPPVFGEFQTQSIAMSACRSRLREKLLLQSDGGGVGVGGSLDLQFVCSDDSSDITPTALDMNAAAAVQTSYARHCKSTDVVGERSSGVKRPASADSLAKQTLIAAQVFNLIPAERARDRNFMAGRLSVNSLFGPAELVKVLPAREVKIYVCTWNMNGQNPPKSMGDFVLPHSIEFVPDLVVVGSQESCSVRSEWEVSLQETLGPSHVLLHSAALGTLHLAVFMRRDLIWYCSVPEDASLSVRPGTAFRTKGAVAISFSLFGTSMLFVTSHLTAHQQKVKERVQDVKRIIHSLDLPRNLNVRSKNKDVTQNFDCVFWCGDLNFRLGEPREKVLEWIECTKFPLPAHLPNGYLHTDQLKSVLSNGAAFKDFQEANITFPPTYKYDPGTQFFDTSSKQRAPAYTDRILFKSKSLPTGVRRGSNLAMLLSGGGISSSGGGQHHSVQILECMAYDSVPSIVTSDHKPVWALFRCSVRPGSDAVPLAAGLFNRDVYLEGMKRRLNSANADSSSVCVIQ